MVLDAWIPLYKGGFMDAPKFKIKAKGTVKKPADSKAKAADKKPPEQPEKTEPKPEPKTDGPKKYVISEGKVLTTLYGVRKAGDDIDAKMISGGKKSFDDLIKRGYVRIK
jgi:hypothetical protein